MKTRFRQNLSGRNRARVKGGDRTRTGESDPEKDYLREEGRVPSTEWVVFTKDPSRRGNEKAGFENQGNRKGQVRLIIRRQKAFGEKQNGARKFLFALFLLVVMPLMSTARMIAERVPATFVAMKDQFMQTLAHA